jgi:archaetidylinositol phosphate synthase
LLNRLRRAVEPYINRLGFAAAQTGLPADAWTIIGLTFAALSALSYSQLYFGGFLGGFLLLVSGIIDVIDGSVARITRTMSLKGAFLDSTLDRMAEVLVFTGIISSGIGNPTVILLSLSFSLLVSYVRAKGESLQVKVSGIGLGERAERILVLAILSLGGYTYYGVVVVLILAFITFIHRLIRVVKALSMPAKSNHYNC